MYIYVIARPENMEHVLETATAGDEARRDANELRLCRRKFFHSTGKDWMEKSGLGVSLRSIRFLNLLTEQYLCHFLFWIIWRFYIEISSVRKFENV